MKISHELANEIAGYHEMGFSCFLSKESTQLIAFPNEIDFLIDNPKMKIDEEFEAWREDIQVIRKSSGKFQQIQKMSPTDSFRVMEGFIETVKDRQLKDRLLFAIQMKKPFAHFKSEIDNSGSERERWFEFRRQRFIDWVNRQVSLI